nr:MAG TPA: hypothetical protein [Caudoviricetes sp.]
MIRKPGELLETGKGLITTIYFKYMNVTKVRNNIRYNLS